MAARPHRQSGGWLGRTALREAPGCVLVPDAVGLSRADPAGARKAAGDAAAPRGGADPPARRRSAASCSLTAPAGIDAGLRQLQTLPGIGCWTANYFALRGWQAKISLPDDYLIKQRFPGMTPAAIARLCPPLAADAIPTRCCISVYR